MVKSREHQNYSSEQIIKKKKKMYPFILGVFILSNLFNDIPNFSIKKKKKRVNLGSTIIS